MALSARLVGTSKRGMTTGAAVMRTSSMPRFSDSSCSSPLPSLAGGWTAASGTVVSSPGGTGNVELYSLLLVGGGVGPFLCRFWHSGMIIHHTQHPPLVQGLALGLLAWNGYSVCGLDCEVHPWVHHQP